MKYKYIVWDWNGTIIDDVALSVKIFNAMCDSYGLENITLEEYRRSFRIPVAGFYEERGFDFSKINLKTIGEFYIEQYNKLRFDCSLHSDILNVMETMKSNGVGQSILSAYEHNNLCDCVSYFGLNKYMDNVFGLENVLAGSKEMRAKALIKRIDIDPKSVLMVGDTTHDKDAADAMGADCVFVSKGHNDKDRLLELGVPVFDSHISLVDFVLG